MIHQAQKIIIRIILITIVMKKMNGKEKQIKKGNATKKIKNNRMMARNPEIVFVSIHQSIVGLTVLQVTTA